MPWNSITRQTFTLVVAFALLTTGAVSPVAAGDGLLSDDDDGTLTNTTDVVDSTVDSTTDTVDSTTDGVDSTGTIDSTTDTVDSTVDATTDTVDSASPAGASAPDAGDVSGQLPADVGQLPAGTTLLPVRQVPSGVDSVPVDQLPTGTVLVPVGQLPTDQLPSGLDSVSPGELPAGTALVPVAPDQVDRLPSGVDSIPVDELPAGTKLVPLDQLPSGSLPTDPSELNRRTVSTDDLPVDADRALDPVEQTLPTGEQAPVQPEDSPYGSQGSGLMNACRLPADESDLPLEAVPSTSELPVSPSVPGVPVSLLTPGTVASIAFGATPRPCEVYDPHDPAVDPTNPPEDPSAAVTLYRVEATQEGVALVAGARGSPGNAWPGANTVAGVEATRDHVGVAHLSRVDYGSRDIVVFSNTTHLVGTASGQGNVWSTVLGNRVNGEMACSGTRALGNTTLEGPAGACDYAYGGLPRTGAGPGTVVDTVQNPPSPGLGDLGDQIPGAVKGRLPGAVRDRLDL